MSQGVSKRDSNMVNVENLTEKEFRRYLAKRKKSNKVIFNFIKM